MYEVNDFVKILIGEDRGKVVRVKSVRRYATDRGYWVATHDIDGNYVENDFYAPEHVEKVQP